MISALLLEPVGTLLVERFVGGAERRDLAADLDDRLGAEHLLRASCETYANALRAGPAATHRAANRHDRAMRPLVRRLAFAPVVVFVVTALTYAMTRLLRPDLYGPNPPSVLS